MTHAELNSVQEFYKGKTIFITGASGFMGKVLVEKLLYSCSELKQLILLMRVKKGKSEATRVKEFEALPLFERIMKEKPEVMRKIMVVAGEITEPNLGLSEAHLQHVIDHTNIFFHVAASIRFTAPLKSNVLTNMVATQEALAIAKRVKNLIVLMHVSTAFCSVEQTPIEERVYESPGDPLSLISLAKQMEESAMSALEDQLLGPHPNTYTYTKRLAEILVRDEYRNSSLPICIVRPSIVGPTIKQPMAGWVDSLSAVSGIIFGVAKGVLRCVIADKQNNFDFIAVDQAINGFIMAAKKTGTAEKRSEEIPVFNLTTHERGLFTYHRFEKSLRMHIFKLAFMETLWYINLTCTRSEPYFWINVYLFQLFPAYLFDFLRMILGKKRYLVEAQRKIIASTHLLKFFALRRWKFNTKNFQDLMLIQSADERKMFDIDTKHIDVDEYLKDCLVGVRIYLQKDPLTTIPKAVRQMRLLYILDIIVKFIFFYWIFKALWNFTGLAEQLWT